VDAARPQLKLVNSVILLLLNYGNGAVSLPGAVAYPDWDFLAVILAATVGLCVTAFVCGWWLGQVFRAEWPRRVALMFGLGMSNNGSGLVLAGLTLAALPQAMLPLIVYNLVQHLVAGTASFLLGRVPAVCNTSPNGERGESESPCLRFGLVSRRQGGS
jgi:BASS family bile acid:Na+ symporter